jgi:hypothetical protein
LVILHNSSFVILSVHFIFIIQKNIWGRGFLNRTSGLKLEHF